MSCLALSITITALVGAGLAPTPALATLPLSLQFIATAAMTIPASLLMGRFGRRAGFTFSGLLGMDGGAISCVAVFLGNFWLFFLGCAFLGGFGTHGQHYRLAAAAVARPAQPARALSYVMLGRVHARGPGPEPP